METARFIVEKQTGLARLMEIGQYQECLHKADSVRFVQAIPVCAARRFLAVIREVGPTTSLAPRNLPAAWSLEWHGFKGPRGLAGHGYEGPKGCGAWL